MTLSNSLYEWTLDVPTGDYGITINDTWEMDYVARMVFRYQFIIADLNRMVDGAYGSLDVSSENWNQAHGEGESSYNALEVYGTSSTGAVAFGKRFRSIL